MPPISKGQPSPCCCGRRLAVFPWYWATSARRIFSGQKGGGDGKLSGRNKDTGCFSPSSASYQLINARWKSLCYSKHNWVSKCTVSAHQPCSHMAEKKRHLLFTILLLNSSLFSHLLVSSIQEAHAGDSSRLLNLLSPHASADHCSSVLARPWNWFHPAAPEGCACLKCVIIKMSPSSITAFPLRPLRWGVVLLVAAGRGGGWFGLAPGNCGGWLWLLPGAEERWSGECYAAQADWIFCQLGELHKVPVPPSGDFFSWHLSHSAQLPSTLGAGTDSVAQVPVSEELCRIDHSPAHRCSCTGETPSWTGWRAGWWGGAHVSPSSIRTYPSSRPAFQGFSNFATPCPLPRLPKQQVLGQVLQKPTTTNKLV